MANKKVQGKLEKKKKHKKNKTKVGSYEAILNAIAFAQRSGLAKRYHGAELLFEVHVPLPG
jgi:hypothetical protein